MTQEPGARASGRQRPAEGRTRRPEVSRWVHGLAAPWVVGMLGLGAADPEAYRRLLQEDYLVEWWTVMLFGAAGLFALRLAWRARRLFDGLVGAFCIFVAGEEFSWGQRLLAGGGWRVAVLAVGSPPRRPRRRAGSRKGRRRR